MEGETKNNSDFEFDVNFFKKLRLTFNFMFWYVLISAIVITLLLTCIMYKVINSNHTLSFEFQDSILVVLSVLGIFIAFTAINIYSIFNSKITEESINLEKLRNTYQKKIISLEKDKNLTQKKIKEFEEKVNKYEGKINDNESKIRFLIEKLTLENSLILLCAKETSIVNKATYAEKLNMLIVDKKQRLSNEADPAEKNELENSLSELRAMIKARIASVKGVTNEQLKSAFSKLNKNLESNDLVSYG